MSYCVCTDMAIPLSNVPFQFCAQAKGPLSFVLPHFVWKYGNSSSWCFSSVNIWSWEVIPTRGIAPLRRRWGVFSTREIKIFNVTNRQTHTQTPPKNNQQEPAKSVLGNQVNAACGKLKLSISKTTSLLFNKSRGSLNNAPWLLSYSTLEILNSNEWNNAYSNVLWEKSQLQ